MSFTEHDIAHQGHTIHVWEGGKGFPILMLHGSGPGAGTIGNWRLVMEPLSGDYRVAATDLIGFGESGRKSETPYFDLGLWQSQAQAVLDRLSDGPVGIIGHSLSASLALRLAIANPRVTKVLTTGAMGAYFTVNDDTVRCWSFPETKDDLRGALETLVFDQSVITEPFLENRIKILHDGVYGPYFKSMFAGDKQSYVDAAALNPEALARLDCDVAMVHGRDDRPFPWAENTLKLAPLMPNADMTVLARCGHSPALEHPDKLLAIARSLFG